MATSSREVKENGFLKAELYIKTGFETINSKFTIFTHLGSQPFEIACQEFSADNPSRSNPEDQKCIDSKFFQLERVGEVFL